VLVGIVVALEDPKNLRLHRILRCERGATGHGSTREVSLQLMTVALLRSPHRGHHQRHDLGEASTQFATGGARAGGDRPSGG